MSKVKFEKPGHYTKKDREKISKKDFAGKNKTFPIVTQKDVYDASKLIGFAKNPSKVKQNIIKIAKRKGFDIPKSWKKK